MDLSEDWGAGLGVVFGCLGIVYGVMISDWVTSAIALGAVFYAAATIRLQEQIRALEQS